jgi:hypothetical protein
LNLMAAAMTHHKAASEPEECMKIAQLAVLEGVAPGIGTCFARVEFYKTKSFEGVSGKPAFSLACRRSGIGGIGWRPAYRRSRRPNRHRTRARRPQ